MRGWGIAPKVKEYTLANEADKEVLRAAGLPVVFKAVSIGDEKGQVAIVPLDESSMENAYLLRSAHDLYEALDSLLKYTQACENLLNASEAVQCRTAKEIMAKARGEL